MALWQTDGNGSWADPANWLGGAVPNSAGAVATFDATQLNFGPGTAVIGAPDTFGDLTLGRIELIGTPFYGTFIIRPHDANTGSTPLVIESGTSEPATIFVDTGGLGNEARIGNHPVSGWGLYLVLRSDLNIVTQDADTSLRIDSDIFGSTEITKLGEGRLLLNGSNSFSGGFRFYGGTVYVDGDDAIGSGGLIFRGGHLVSASTTINNPIYAPLAPNSVDSLAGSISALPGHTVVLEVPSFTHHSATGISFAFGSETNNGTIVLSADQVSVTTSSYLQIAGGTVRFADSYNATRFFRSDQDGLVELINGTLDTTGFATQVKNLAFLGGTLTSSAGALNVIATYSLPQTNNGTITGTALADSLIFRLLGQNSFSLALMTFTNWNDEVDKITLVGSAGNDMLSGTVMADSLFGGVGLDMLFGNAGNDLLNGQAGNDTLSGGLGDDRYIIDSSSDNVIEAFDQGNDLVTASADFVLPDHIERLTLGGMARSGTGNGLGNTIVGSNGSDTLLSGLGGADAINGRDGNDIILGGDGDDLLTGAQGKDTLTGGADMDRFIFRDGDLNATRGSADIVTDFDQALDERIVLNGVDANEALGGIQSLKFIGTAAFSGTAGELRFVQFSGNTYIEGNTDADTVADFMIRLNGLYTLNVTDFIGVTL